MKIKKWLLGAYTVLSLFDPDILFALPEGGVITAGEASISQTSNTSVVIGQITNRAIINWNQFNIAANEQVQFVQPGSHAVALNRITGGSASEIFGSLTANGQIFLINPHGIVFGKSASVDVAGLVATTRDIEDSNFLSGSKDFDLTSPVAGFIMNQGTIRVQDGGLVLMIAPSVSNEGLIRANGGEVILSAKGAADPFSLMVNQSGIIEAKSLVHSGGVIRLITSDEGIVMQSGTLNVSSETPSSFPGEVVLLGGKVAHTGAIFAQGVTEGGFVEISGSKQLQFTGLVDASASNGRSGTLLLDPKNIIIENGGATSISSHDGFADNPSGDSRIDADAITSVINGGTGVILQAHNDITVNEAIIANTNGNVGEITFQAGRSIFIKADIMSNDTIRMTANDSSANSTIRDPGTAEITMDAGTKINAGGGNIEIIMDAVPNHGQITARDLTTTGNIKIINNGEGITLFASEKLELMNFSTITNTNGPITLRADQMMLSGGVVIDAGSGRVALLPNTSGRTIALGTVADPIGVLALSDVELDAITTTGVLQIGNANNPGAISITAPIDTKNVETMTLIAGSGGISQSAPIVEQNLRIESVGAVRLTDINNNIEVLSARVSGEGAPFILTSILSPVVQEPVDGVTGIIAMSGVIQMRTRADLVENASGAFRSDLSPIFSNPHGLLSDLRLDTLTDRFVIIPQSACRAKVEGEDEPVPINGC